MWEVMGRKKGDGERERKKGEGRGTERKEPGKSERGQDGRLREKGRVEGQKKAQELSASHANHEQWAALMCGALGTVYPTRLLLILDCKRVPGFQNRK